MDYMLKTWWREIVMVPVALTIHRGGILRSSGVPSVFFCNDSTSGYTRCEARDQS